LALGVCTEAHAVSAVKVRTGNRWRTHFIRVLSVALIGTLHNLLQRCGLFPPSWDNPRRQDRYLNRLPFETMRPIPPMRRKGQHRGSAMTCGAAPRDIFLKIERVTAYGPLAPEPCARRWGRDDMFNPGHELGRVQPGEIVATTLDLLVYHEYFDTHYTHPNTA